MAKPFGPPSRPGTAWPRDSCPTRGTAGGAGAPGLEEAALPPAQVGNLRHQGKGQRPVGDEGCFGTDATLRSSPGRAGFAAQHESTEATNSGTPALSAGGGASAERPTAGGHGSCFAEATQDACARPTATATGRRVGQRVVGCGVQGRASRTGNQLGGSSRRGVRDGMRLRSEPGRRSSA